jgi:hypothetical protein
MGFDQLLPDDLDEPVIGFGHVSALR